MDIKKAFKQFNDQRNHCSPTRPKKRVDIAGNTIEFRLSFDEWVALWVASGHYAQRGRGAGKCCMSRIDDLGHYEVGNVFIQLHGDNTRDGTKAAASRRCRPVKPPKRPYVRKTLADVKVKRTISEAMKEVGKRTHVCPNCGKEGVGLTMRRWHFSNCQQASGE